MVHNSTLFRWTTLCVCCDLSQNVVRVKSESFSLVTRVEPSHLGKILESSQVNQKCDSRLLESESVTWLDTTLMNSPYLHIPPCFVPSHSWRERFQRDSCTGGPESWSGNARWIQMHLGTVRNDGSKLYFQSLFFIMTKIICYHIDLRTQMKTNTYMWNHIFNTFQQKYIKPITKIFKFIDVFIPQDLVMNYSIKL